MRGYQGYSESAEKNAFHAMVGAALLSTGVIVGLLSGGPPLRRALRQLLIGYAAAATTYLLGLLFGAGMS